MKAPVAFPAGLKRRCNSVLQTLCVGFKSLGLPQTLNALNSLNPKP